MGRVSGAGLQPLMVRASDMPGAMMNGGDGFPQLQVQGIDRPAGITDARMKKRLSMWKRNAVRIPGDS
ncbi:MAG: hypothetical protein U0936_23605 [Planctomycetaceae bacterium]